MKYQIVINQAGVVAAGLHDKTDLADWAILGHVYSWQANSRADRIGDRVWINYRNLMSELPLLGLSSKGAVANRIDKLRALNLLETEQVQGGRLFAKTTPYYETIAEYREPPLASKTVHENEQVFTQENTTVQSGEQGPVQSGERIYPKTISNPSTSNPIAPVGAQAKSAERKRDLLWEAMLAGCGIPLHASHTKAERGRWNAALKILREAGASEEEIKVRCKRYRKIWPNVSLTPTALAANWTTMVSDHVGSKPRDLKGDLH